jgi:hypothetical protein
MKSKYEFEIGTDKVRCEEFFDIDSQYNGIDVYVNDEHIGEMWDKSIPDDLDSDYTEFEKEVEKFIDEN